MAAGPLITIVGPTASGKSALGLEIARRFNGEIICADSRTIYKGMDIGTAKPSKKEQTTVPHHLLDIVEPDQPFSVGDFKRLATKVIGEVHARGKIPIVVGGTGLYVNSLLFDYQFSGSDAQPDELNPRHLKKLGSSKLDQTPRPNTLVLGLNLEPRELESRIKRRVRVMLNSGLESEVKGLTDKYGWTEAMTAVGYREWQAYFNGVQTIQETEELIFTRSRQYAKRQRTWFKRNKSIQWISTPGEAIKITEQFLEDQHSH